MAERFYLEEIYEQESWTVILSNTDGIQERFFELVQAEIEKSEFPGLDITYNEYKTGGWIFDSEFTKMLKVAPQKSQFKKFAILYRCQAFGNTVILSRYECMAAGFFDTLTGKGGSEIYGLVREKCKNLAQIEEFVAIDQLADLVYDLACAQIDPEYRERKLLKDAT
jgi:hypothetical protein